MPKSIIISILLLILPSFGKRTVRPTRHYIENHCDVDWDLVLLAVLSPTRTHPNSRRGKDRHTFLRTTKNGTIEVHAKIDNEGNAWVINAFRGER